MSGEKGIKNFKELHEPGRDVFRQSEIGMKGEGRADPAQGFRAERTGERTLRGGLANAQEASSQRVEEGGVEFVELAISVNQHTGLLG